MLLMKDAFGFDYYTLNEIQTKEARAHIGRVDLPEGGAILLLMPKGVGTPRLITRDNDGEGVMKTLTMREAFSLSNLAYRESDRG